MEIYKDYDLLVIGAGPGGMLVAKRAAKNGLKVAIFEKNALGGICLNEGCMPTKAYLKIAKIYHSVCHGESYGITNENAKLDQSVALARKNSVVEKLNLGCRGGLRKNKVAIIFNKAEILGKENDLFLVESEGKVYSGKYLVIATGSEVALPKIDGLKTALERGVAVTSKELLDIDKIPEKLVIVGGGIIGLEAATYFSIAGSEVKVVEFTDKICGNLDRECSDVVRKNLEKTGVEFMLSTAAKAIRENKLLCILDGKEIEIDFDKVLVCTGRKPNASGFGLEKLGVETDKKGGIVTDDHMRTNVKNLYAIGDVNGKVMLAHTSYREAEVCADNICGKDVTMDYSAIPSCIYTMPEAGWCGESEESATAKNLNFEVRKLPMSYCGRFVVESNGEEGLIKTIIEKGTERILGGAIVGDYASEIIAYISNFITLGLSVKDIDKLILPHPSVCETIKDALNHK